MAKFKVGDRVRRARRFDDMFAKVGSVGTVVPPDEGWTAYTTTVKWDIPPAAFPNGITNVKTDTLEPLTPPAADEWARSKVEQIKKWKPDPSILNPQKVKQ